MYKMVWFLSQVGKASDCNSLIDGSNPPGTSTKASAPIDQLDRLSGYEPGGCEFESYWAHHIGN